MDAPEMTAAAAPDALVVTVPGARGAAPCPVAETMRRVQAQLRSGAVPTFDALLAYGVPGVR